MTSDSHLPPDALSKALAIVHAGMGANHPSWGRDVEVWEELAPWAFRDEVVGRILDAGGAVVLKAFNHRASILKKRGNYQCVIGMGGVPMLRYDLPSAIRYARFGTL